MCCDGLSKVRNGNIVCLTFLSVHQVMARDLKVWVKVIGDEEEDAFKVDCNVDMDIDSLKKAIVLEKGYRVDQVKKIYPNRGEDTKALAPDVLVVKPVGGAIGSNASKPYWFTLAAAPGKPSLSHYNLFQF